MPLYTAQMKYGGCDRLDITIKSGTMVGKLYAPTWDMVMGHKNKKYTDEQYTKMYYDLLTERWEKDWNGFRQATINTVSLLSGTFTMPAFSITLVCYCPAGAFCHRVLLAKWFEDTWPSVKYLGER